MSNDSDASGQVNPYAAPAHAGESAIEPARDSTVEELRAFVGDNAAYYLTKWLPILNGRARGAGFNLAAFFLSGLWFGYRKMYKAACVLFGIVLVQMIASTLFFQGYLGEEESPDALDRVWGILVAGTCGVMANRWYLLHARRAIHDARAQGLSHEELLQALSKAGGTSLLASLGMFALFIVAVAATVFALNIILAVLSVE